MIANSSSSIGVSIGNQIWSKKNLDVTTYRNGDPIPQVTSNDEWANLTTGAWCYYNNDPANDFPYGKLYNWYALNDPRGLAPSGWHIPNENEWTILTNFLGGDALAGGRMKESGTVHWFSPNTGASNSSGFTALPGGGRYGQMAIFGLSGSFSDIRLNGYWWSLNENNGPSAWYRILASTNSRIEKNSYIKSNGFSVRCIKD